MKAKTKAEKEYLNKVAALGCLRCGRPAEIHHVKYGMNNRPHSQVIPLCPYHHRQGPFGDCIENGKKTTQKNWGITEAEMLDRVKYLLEAEEFYQDIEKNLPF